MSTFAQPANGSTDDSDASLVARLRDGDAASFRHLHDRYGRDVYLYASSILGRGAAAQDASQEAWLVLWKSRSSIEVRGATLLPWLLVTTRHKSLHLLREKRRLHLGLDRIEMVPTDPNDEPSARSERSELARFIDNLVLSMTEIDRSLFLRCIRDGQSYASVSRDLGIKSTSAKHRISRIRIRMRSAITSQEEL